MPRSNRLQGPMRERPRDNTGRAAATGARCGAPRRTRSAHALPAQCPRSGSTAPAQCPHSARTVPAQCPH
eukprot:8876233-Lingulodinium_polyedra.AAC.1